MVEPVRHTCLCRSFWTLLESFDKRKYRCFVFTTVTEFVEYWVRGPFRMVFQFENDRSVYVISQVDLYPEFDPVDYIQWFLSDDHVCCSFASVDWPALKTSLDNPMNLMIFYYYVPNCSFADYWESAVVYTGLFSPSCLPLRPAW